MDAVFVIAGIAVALLAVEFLLPTGGVLAVVGAGGLIAAGIVALGVDDSNFADYFGPGLITLGVLSVATFFVITPKLISAHRDEPVRTGWEELIGGTGEVRRELAPAGQIFINGALWQARVGEAGPVPVGSSVKVTSVDGLTLVVERES